MATEVADTFRSSAFDVPPKLAPRAWPAYLRAVQAQTYYVSVEGLVATCAVAKTNIAVWMLVDGRMD